MDADTRYVARHSDQPSSRGSLTYNTLYEELGLNAAYLQFAGVSAQDFVSSMKQLGFAGSTIVGRLSTEVLPFLDDLDESAQRAHAVNTVVYRDGLAVGYKTDGPALVEALTEAVSIDGKGVAVAGAGHLVSEIAPLLMRSGARSIDLFVRNEETGRAAAERLGVTYGGHLRDLASASADILINATPIGGRGCDEKALLPDDTVGRFGAVLDTSFDPSLTPLINAALAHGVPAVTGLRMFAYQGAAQVRHYLGVEPPVDRIEQLIGTELVG